MKKAFTLSELIVAIGIVGVIAAMTTPFLSGLFPDSRKIQVLKAYRIISDINAELLSDPSIYQLGTPININGTLINNCIGLMCEQISLNPEFNNASYEGADKYANLLMTKLEGFFVGDEIISAENGLGGFHTDDGVAWAYNEVTININDNTMNATLQITLPNDGCGLYSNRCENPNIFRFNIDINGKLTGLDEMTQAYLENPDRLNDKKADLARARALWSANNPAPQD